MSDNKAELKWDGRDYTMNIIVGSENEKAIDIGRLLEDTDLITLDLGYKNTGSTTSAITFLDGDKGILRYRGYSIEDLAESCSFTEVMYLLLYGELPNTAQLSDFSTKLGNNYEVPEQLAQIFGAFPPGAHPMSHVGALLYALTGYHE